MYFVLWLFFDSYYLSCPFAFLALFNLPINFKVFNLHFCIRRAATETTTKNCQTMNAITKVFRRARIFQLCSIVDDGKLRKINACRWILKALSTTVAKKLKKINSEHSVKEKREPTPSRVGQWSGRVGCASSATLLGLFLL